MKGCRPLNREETRAAIATAKDSREGALVALGVATGFRIGELLSLKIQDVIDARGRAVSWLSVKAANTKTKVGRVVRLNTQAAAAAHAHALAMLKAGRALSDALFTGEKSRRGQAISRQHATRLVRALFERADIRGAVSTHTLRKTFADTIYKATGGSIEKVQQALGHATITSTVAYLSFRHSDIDDAIMAIEW